MKNWKIILLVAIVSLAAGIIYTERGREIGNIALDDNTSSPYTIPLQKIDPQTGYYQYLEGQWMVYFGNNETIHWIADADERDMAYFMEKLSNTYYSKRGTTNQTSLTNRTFTSSNDSDCYIATKYLIGPSRYGKEKTGIYYYEKIFCISKKQYLMGSTWVYDMNTSDAIVWVDRQTNGTNVKKYTYEQIENISMNINATKDPGYFLGPSKLNESGKSGIYYYDGLIKSDGNAYKAW